MGWPIEHSAWTVLERPGVHLEANESRHNRGCPTASTDGLQAPNRPTGVSGRGPALAGAEGLAEALQPASFSLEATEAAVENAEQRVRVSPELRVNGCRWAAWIPAAFKASGGAGRDRRCPWAQQSWRKGTALGQLVFPTGSEQVSAPQIRPVFILSSPAQS